jgi:putative FmdB family regulatory protein
VPTYEYACKQCAEHLEVVQKFTDDALTTCPSCGGPLRKVFGAVGISFKGSGFYKTDSRGSSKPAAASTSETSTSSESSSSGSADSTPAPKADAPKPAATTGSAAAS